MKLRAFSLLAAVLVLAFTLWPVWAQNQTGDSKPPAATDAGTSTGGQTASSPPSNASTSQKPDQPPSNSPSSNAPEAAPSSKPPDKETHDRGKNDIDDIGNRNIGNGKGLGNWYSLEKEIAMGKQYARQVEASVRLVQDPVVAEYVNRVGQNLVRNSDAKVPFTIKVIDSDEINAFALPGGFFFVNSGLILAADEEAELAGVMAHEIAHVAARHATRQMTRANLANIASIPLIFVGGGIGYAVRSAAGLAMPVTFLTFSRGFEAEADYLGLQYMYKTGYDPQAFISFFEKIEAKEKKQPGSLAKAFSTHPQTPDRIGKSQEEIEHVLPPRDQYIVNTSEFEDVKSRLASLENRKKIVGQKDSNGPSLRRNSQGQQKNGDDSSGDDRPTLKRRDEE